MDDTSSKGAAQGKESVAHGQGVQAQLSRLVARPLEPTAVLPTVCATMVCTAAFAAWEDHDAHQARAFGRRGRNRLRPGRRPTGMGPNLSDAPGEDGCATASGLRA